MRYLLLGRWLLGLALVLAAWPARAQDDAPPATEPAKPDDSGLVIVNEGETPPSRILSVREDLMARSKSALSEAVLYLRSQARKEDNRLFVAPVRTRKQVGTKEVERKYREEVVDIPIYKITYETYETIANVRKGSSTGEASLQKVKRTREIRKQVDTKKETRLIHDNNGPITRMINIPVYEPGGPDHLYSGFWAQNAAAVMMLAKLGVPLDDMDFAAGIQTLTNYLDGYGLPDRTYDIAWLAACYSTLAKLNPQQKEWPALARRLVSKLLLAQHQSEPSKGLWGPVAVHNDLLAAAILYERDLYNKEVSSWQEKLDKNPKSDYYIKKVKEGKERVQEFRQVVNDVSMQGLAFENIRSSMLITPPDAFLTKVAFTIGPSTVSGMPMHLYSENIADIECTAVALMALREAAEAGFLMDRVAVPKTLEGKPLVSFPDTTVAIAQAAAALAKLQTKDGTWPEANFWAPVHAYDKIGLPELPVNDRKFVSLESPVTQVSTVQGYQALLDATRILGETAAKQYAPALARGEKPLLEYAAAIADRKKSTVPPGGLNHLHPYYFLGYIDALLRGTNAGESDHPQLWQDLAEYLIIEQPKADMGGSWAKPGQYWSLHPVQTPYSKESARTNWEARMAGLPADQRKPYDPKTWRHPHGYGVYSQRDLASTLAAMNFLSQGLRPAAAAAWAYDAKPSRTVNLRPVVEFLSKKHKVALTYTQVPEHLPPESLEGVPVLLITGRGPAFTPTSATSLDHLRHYLLNLNGLLVAEVTADADGLAFARSLSEAIIKLFPEAKVAPLPVKDKEPPVSGVVDGGGRPLVAVLPVQTQAGGGGLNANQIRQFIFGQVSANMKPEYLSPELGLDWNYVMEKEPELLRGEEDARNKALEEAATKGAEGK